MTTALDVKAALLATLKAQPALDAVQTTWGFPSKEPQRKWVFVGRITWDNAEWATNRSRREQYAIHVVFDVQISGGDAQDAETAVRDLAASFEDAVKANPCLGVANVISTSLVPKKLESFPADQVYEAQFEFEFHVEARI